MQESQDAGLSYPDASGNERRVYLKAREGLFVVEAFYVGSGVVLYAYGSEKRLALWGPHYRNNVDVLLRGGEEGFYLMVGRERVMLTVEQVAEIASVIGAAFLQAGISIPMDGYQFGADLVKLWGRRRVGRP